MCSNLIILHYLSSIRVILENVKQKGGEKVVFQKQHGFFIF